ncbi:MAG: hypothetical protein EXR99_02890 [Gemmataceae bacterium]|nr:hypothetical protein [Gemmataceae bacterium]
MIIRKALLVCCLTGLTALDSWGEPTPANTSAAKPAAWWNPFGSKKDGAAEVEVKDKESIQKSVAGEQHRKILAREEKAYFRRLEACDRLMQIAIKKNDMETQTKILSLQERIQQVYSRKTANLPVPAQYPATPNLESPEDLKSEALKLLGPDAGETGNILSPADRKGGNQP